MFSVRAHRSARTDACMNLAHFPAWLRPPVPICEGGMRVHKCSDLPAKREFRTQPIAIVVNGVRYRSVHAAAMATGTPRSTLRRRMGK